MVTGDPPPSAQANRQRGKRFYFSDASNILNFIRWFFAWLIKIIWVLISWRERLLERAFQKLTQMLILCGLFFFLRSLPVAFSWMVGVCGKKWFPEANSWSIRWELKNVWHYICKLVLYNLFSERGGNMLVAQLRAQLTCFLYICGLKSWPSCLEKNARIRGKRGWNSYNSWCLSSRWIP